MLETNSNQFHCLADLVLTAFLECLTPREASISLAQLHTRNFTPHSQATRDCICYLFKQGRVDIVPVVERKRGRITARDTLVSLKLDPPQIPKLIITLSYRIKENIFNFEVESLIQRLNDEVKVYECIEYCRFYLSREGLELQADPVQSYKLHLMVIELAHEQVFMVLWRAVKTASASAHQQKSKSVSLNQVCDLAYNYFIGYRKLNIEIDFYRMPYSLGNSALRNVISKYI